MAIILENAKKVPFWRHLAAILYDSFLILALWILLGFIFIAINKGEAIDPNSNLMILFRFSLFFTVFIFFVYFWSGQAQTLGMRAWRIVIVNEENKTLTFKQAAKRFFYLSITLFLFGFLWRLVDKDKQTFYDKLAKTKLYLVTKNPY